MNGLVAEHAVTRSVRDSAALLDATAGPAIGDPYYPPLPLRPFLQEVGAEPVRLRIAFTTSAATGVPIHADCVRAVHDAAKLCSELGHVVSEAAPSVDAELLVKCFTVVWMVGCAFIVEGTALLTQQNPTPDQFEELTWELAQQGRALSGPTYMGAVSILQRIARQVARFFESYDIWLTPTLAEPPLPLGSFDAQPGNPMAGFQRAIAIVPFTPICNVTGQPAMSMPLFWNAEGLPVGTHFVGRFGDEAALFRLAAQLEAARPWAARHPTNLS